MHGWNRCGHLSPSERIHRDLLTEKHLLILLKASLKTQVKVTVQFDTEKNGQNEIVSLMDRSEANL